MLTYEPEHRFVSREEAEKLSATGSHLATPGARMLAELDEIWSTNHKLAPHARSAKLHHVYFPYINTVAEVLDEANHRALMAVRNIGPRSLTAQRTMADLSLLCVGASVGSVSLHALLRSGACRKVMLFDADTLDGSNLNRLDASFVDVGLPKVQVAGRKIALVNPYVEYTGVCDNYDNQSQALVEETLPGGVDVVVEAVDDMTAKAITRLDSHKWRALHLMPTDLGHTAMLDVQCPGDKATMFGLKASELTELAEGKVSKATMQRMMLRLVGLRNVAPAMLKSFLDFQNGELPGIPQLHSTAAKASTMVVHAVEAHVSGHGLATGRYRCNSRKVLNLKPNMPVGEALQCYAKALRKTN